MGITEGEMYANNTAGNNLKFIPAREISNDNELNGLEIVDQKRRRVDRPNLNGLTEEHSKSIEDTDMIVTQSNDNTQPKNLLLAGSALQTRLSS